MIMDTKQRRSPLVQGGLDISVKAVVEWIQPQETKLF